MSGVVEANCLSSPPASPYLLTSHYFIGRKSEDSLLLCSSHRCSLAPDGGDVGAVPFILSGY